MVMHSHLHSHAHDEPQGSRWQILRRRLLQLFICCVLVISTPFVLPAIFGDGVAEIRSITMEGGVAPENYDGRVQSVQETNRQFEEFRQVETITQQVEVEVTSGPDIGLVFSTERTADVSNTGLLFAEGDHVVVEKNTTFGGDNPYFLVEKNRLNAVWMAAGVFVIGALLLAGLRGITSLLSLTFGVMVVGYYLVPQILLGSDPLLTTFVTVFIITVVSMFLAHGFDRRIVVAVAGTVVTLLLSTLFAIAAVELTRLTGTVNETAFDLQGTRVGANLNLRGLLLAGIIIGAVGVMDDVTTAQAAGVDEISRANPSLTPRQLFTRGISIGQEHAISLVNTLAFAYLGTGLPLILLITAYRLSDWWVLLNSEFIAEEIIRTLVGSIALLLAIPVTTAMAAFWLRAKPDTHKHHHHTQDDHDHAHEHTEFSKLKKMNITEAVEGKSF